MPACSWSVVPSRVVSCQALVEKRGRRRKRKETKKNSRQLRLSASPPLRRDTLTRIQLQKSFLNFFLASRQGFQLHNQYSFIPLDRAPIPCISPTRIKPFHHFDCVLNVLLRSLSAHLSKSVRNAALYTSGRRDHSPLEENRAVLVRTQHILCQRALAPLTAGPQPCKLDFERRCS